jgi:hypothetical protein
VNDPLDPKKIKKTEGEPELESVDSDEYMQSAVN